MGAEVLPNLANEYASAYRYGGLGRTRRTPLDHRRFLYLVFIQTAVGMSLLSFRLLKPLHCTFNRNNRASLRFPFWLLSLGAFDASRVSRIWTRRWQYAVVTAARLIC